MPPTPSSGMTLALDPPRGQARDRWLFERYHDEGDVGARDRLVDIFLPLARQLARRYERPNVPLDDLVQVASLGLLKAIDRYEPSHGTPFSSYAVPTILGELKRYFRDATWAVRVPRGLQEQVIGFSKAVNRLSTQFGRSPTTAELAEALDVSTEEVLETREAATAFSAVSLEAPGHSAEGDEAASFLERLGTEDERYELIDYASAIQPTLAAMAETERVILRLRFDHDLTQSEIAEQIGVSQMQVSRLLRRSLDRLRTVAEAA